MIAAIATTNIVASQECPSSRSSTVASRRRTSSGTRSGFGSVGSAVAAVDAGSGWSALALSAVDALVTRRS
ncbi:hypothetical protein Jiend_21130 [Micromonospora endophytica]|nr:hypothetical protein Jiend_21130 [Micromonospora endophytica]